MSAEQIVERDLGGRRFQRHVRHARERHARPVVGVQAAVRSLLADQRRQLARRLPVDEHPVTHDVPAVRLHALIVVAGGRQPARLRAIADQVDDLGAEAQLAGVGRLAGSSCPPCWLPSPARDRARSNGRPTRGWPGTTARDRRRCRSGPATTGFAFSFSTTSWPAFSASAATDSPRRIRSPAACARSTTARVWKSPLARSAAVVVNCG